MVPNDDTVKTEVSAQQEARAKLRESFVKAIQELQGEKIKVLTYELSTLQGTFSGWKPDGTEVLVKDLETPAHVKMASALLRTLDILAIQFERPVQLP